MSSKKGSAAIDRARETLCREFARMLRSGAFTLRSRIVRRGAEPVEAWFYAHRDDGWEKQSASIAEPALVQAIEETLDMLASKGHADEWSSKRHVVADHQDTDFQFHREKLQEHLGDQLESAIAGLLFRDSHDSKKDVRRSIRTRR
jgi:hypothetical protein